MASNEITARVTLQGEIKANATLGVPVNVYIDREVYDGETDITPTEDDITLETAGKAVLDDILIHGVPQVPHTLVASGSFVKQGTGVTYTLDTHSTKWTKLLIKPHTFPHTGMAASAISRAIMAKFVDLELDAMITAYMSSAGTAFNAGSYKRISTGDECDVKNGIVTMTGESSTTGKWINGIQYDWYAWNDGEELEPKRAVEGRFKATETGMLTIDTGYEGTGYPKMILFHQNDNLDDSNLEDFANQSFMSIEALKCYPQEPEYAETVNLDSYMLSLAYKYGTGTATRFTQSTGYVLSQETPTYKISNAFKMPNNRTLKVWAGDSYTGDGGYFMVGVEYRYRIIYTEPVSVVQSDNIFEGTFQTDTTGVLTIDTGYDGDSYPKAIMIYDADGIIKEDVPKAYTITAYSALKNNATDPTYDGDTANNGFRYQVVYTGTVTYTATGGAATYIFSQTDPVMGTNSVKMPDSKTLKIYVTDVTASSAIRFRTGIRYKYQVIY